MKIKLLKKIRKNFIISISDRIHVMAYSIIVIVNKKNNRTNEFFSIRMALEKCCNDIGMSELVSNSSRKRTANIAKKTAKQIL